VTKPDLSAARPSQGARTPLGGRDPLAKVARADFGAEGGRGGQGIPEGVQRVAAYLQSHDHPHSPRMLDDAARTAQQAADALGIALGQIAKSIIFRRVQDDAAVLVITSGDKRVDEKKVAAMVGDLGRADASFVKTKTGFSIGGVAPVTHASTGVVLIDRELFRFAEIWAAAGHPHAVFALTPAQLERMTGAPVADVVV
jgi:prolyl-tRNA editing enzyme YbaK/EbsC (Cys-tRNA(Pro) deacylase)